MQALFGVGAVFWPLVIGLAGVALLWRQADEVQRERWLDNTGRIDPVRVVFGAGGWASYARVAAGVLLVVEAGGMVSDLEGGLDVLGTGSVCAGNLDLQPQILERLKAAA